MIQGVSGNGHSAGAIQSVGGRVACAGSARRGFVSLLGLLLAASLLTLVPLSGGAGAQSTPVQNADGSYTVPEDWALIPSGVGPGGTFRLMFMTTSQRNAIPSDIGVYDTFVRNAAAGGHAAIRGYGSLFRVVGSTGSVHARDHLGMNPGSDGAGVPVWWLGGPKVADGNSEFWSDNWQNWTLANRRNQHGTNASGGWRNDWQWTGTNENGSRSSNPLGHGSVVKRGRFQANTADRGPIDGGGNAVRGQSHSFYAMSPVFKVDGEAVPTIVARHSDGAETTIFEVPSDWALVPAGVGVGQDFRLLFRSSTKRDATSADIAVYDEFVQAAAGSGHSAIQLYAPWFKAVGSTVSVDARDHTGTNHNTPEDGEGAQIFWLDGPRVADRNSRFWTDDFATHAWENYDAADMRDESGTAFDASTVGLAWTGTQAGGTARNGQSLGDPADVDIVTPGVQGYSVLAGSADASDLFHRFPVSATNALQTEQHRMLGLSPVFRVSDAVEPSAGELRALAGAPWVSYRTVYENEGRLRVVVSGLDVSDGSVRVWPLESSTAQEADWNLYYPSGGSGSLRTSAFDASVSGGVVRFDLEAVADSSVESGEHLVFGFVRGGVRVAALRVVLADGMRPSGALFRVAADDGGDRVVGDSLGLRMFEGGDPVAYEYRFFEGTPQASWDYAFGHSEVWIAGDAPDGGSGTMLNGVAHVHDKDRVICLPSRDHGHHDPRTGVGQTYQYHAHGTNDPIFPLHLDGRDVVVGARRVFADLTGGCGLSRVRLGRSDVQGDGSGAGRWLEVRLAAGEDPDAFHESFGVQHRMVPRPAAPGTAYRNGVAISPLRHEMVPGFVPGEVAVSIVDDDEWKQELLFSSDNSTWVSWSDDGLDKAIPAELDAGDAHEFYVRLRDPQSTAENFSLNTGWGSRVSVQVSGPGGTSTYSGNPHLGVVAWGSGVLPSKSDTAKFTLRVSDEPASGRRGWTAFSHNLYSRSDRELPVPGSWLRALPGLARDRRDTVVVCVACDEGLSVGKKFGFAYASVEPEVTIAAAPGSVAEGDDIDIVLSAVPVPLGLTPDGTLDVNVAVSAVGDYGVADRTVTVKVGRDGTGTLTVPTVGDSKGEPDGTVTVAVKPGHGYTAGAFSSATIAVEDDDVPTIAITSRGDVTEGGTATFAVAAFPKPSTALTVNIDIAAVGDYGVTTGARTVTVGTSGAATLHVATRDDALDEPDGTVTATVTPDPGYTVEPSAAAATAAVRDNEATPQAVASIGDAIAQEGDPLRFEIALSAPQAERVEVHWATLDYYAEAGADYVFASGVAQFAPGDTAVVVAVDTLADDVDEGTETMLVGLSYADGAAVADDWTGTGTISDDPVTPPGPAVSVTAGPGITEGGTATFTLTADPAPDADLDVRVRVAQQGAYGAAGGVRTITVPVSGTASFTVATADDSTDEPDGQITVTVLSGTGYDPSPAASAATVAVADDDLPTPAVAVTAGPDIAEGDAATFTLTATPKPATPLSVRVRVAQTGAYGATTGVRTVTVPASGTASFTVATSGDSTTEPDGQITVTVLSGTGYDVSRTSTAAVEVADDDTPAVSITAGGAVTEGTAATYTLTASPAPASAVSVRVRVAQTGTFGVTAGVRTITVPASGTATFTVATSGDTADEPDGQITVTVLSGSGYDVSSTASAASVQIADDDLPPPVVSITGGAGVSEGSAAPFTLNASPSPAAALTVRVQVAQSGAFGVTTGVRTVAVPASGTATFTVATTDDTDDEPDGSITVTVLSGTGYALSPTSSSASVAVADDDVPPVPAVSVSGGADVTEGTAARFALNASPSPAAALTVRVQIAQSGAYGVTAGVRTVTVPLSGTASFTVATSGDGVDEPDGAVTVTVLSGSGYDVSPTASAASVTVVDDDVPEVGVAAGGDVTEGSAASFTLSAAPVPALPLSVRVRVTQSGAYGASTGIRTVTVPTSGTASFTVATSGDGVDEPDGAVTVTVLSGSGYDISATASAASVTVVDDDVPEVGVVAGGDVTEGSAASFTLSAAPVPALPLSVRVQVAQSGQFGATTGVRTVTVPASGTGSFTVATSGDGVDEPDGSITVTVLSGTGYVLSPTSSSATVVVADDDDPAPVVGNADTLTVSIAGTQGSPGDTLEFVITASDTAQQDVTVSYSISAIGALIGGLDYDDEPGEITIAEGTSSVTLEVPLAAGIPLFGYEQLYVSLDEVTGAAGFTQGLAVANIRRR